MKKTPPDVAARIEDHYRKGDGYNKTATVLGFSVTLVRRVVDDCPGLARTKEEQLEITTDRRKEEERETAAFTLTAMGLKTAGACIKCGMAIVATIIGSDKYTTSVLKKGQGWVKIRACPICFHARKARNAGNMRPIFWGLR